MGCKYTIPDPANPKGPQVDSILYQDIVEYYTNKGEADPLKADNIYEEVKNWKLNPTLDAEIKRIKPGTAIKDKYNELLFEHVKEYIEGREIDRTVRQPTGALNRTLTIWETKAKELAVEISERAEFLKRRKFSTREKAQMDRLKSELLEVRAATEFITALDNYIKIASAQIVKVYEKINKKDISKIDAQDLQNIDNIIEIYDNIPRITREAETANLNEPGALEVKDPMIKRLRILSENYSRLKEKYNNVSISIVSEQFMGNQHLEYIRDHVRKTIVLTEEGEKKKDETENEYTLRIQNLVDVTIQDNHLYSHEEAKLFFENTLKAGDDISWISRWALQAGNTGSALLRSFNFYIKSMVHLPAKEEYEAKAKESYPTYKAYIEHMKSLGKNTLNTKELYENILDMTSQKAYYVGKRENLWNEHRVQLKKYIQDYINDLISKEAENKDEENYIYWDPEMNRAAKKDDRQRIAKLQKAQRGVYNKTYNELDEGLQNQYKKLTDLQEKRVELYIKKTKLVAKYRGTKDLNSKTVIDQELEEVQSSIYDISDTITGLENEMEFFLFRTEYDVLKLPSSKAIEKIDSRDTDNLKKGEFVSGTVPKKVVKVIFPADISEYNSSKFKKLEELRDKNSEDPQWKYYVSTMETRALSENVYPENYRTYFSLPEIGATGAQRWDEDVDSLLSFNQMWSKWLKPAINQMFGITPGYDYDMRFENTISDEVLQENGYKIDFSTKELPKYYKNTGIDLADQNTNIQFVTLAGYNTAVAYDAKLKILPYVEMFLYLLETRKISESSGGKKIMKKITSNLQSALSNTSSYMERQFVNPKEKETNQIYKNALDMVNTQLFGQAISDELNINIDIPWTNYKVNLRKLSRLFGNAVSLSILSGNIKSGTANMIYGQFQLLQETFGNEYISMKSWGKAQLDYMHNLKGIVADIGKDYPTSIINLLAQKFDPLTEHNPLNTHFKHINKTRAVLNSSSLHGINGMAEHVMHVGTMLGILHETKILDKEGNYLTANKTTKEREKAMSLREAYSKVGDVELMTDKRIAFIEVKRGDRLLRIPYVGGAVETFRITKYDAEKNSVGVNYLTNITQSLNESMHGPYSWITGPPMKRRVLGGALHRMRTWLPKGMEVRWRALDNSMWAMYNAFHSRKLDADGNKQSKFKNLQEYFIGLREGSTAARYFDRDLRLDFVNKGPSKKFDPKKQVTDAGINSVVFEQGSLLGYHTLLKFRDLLGMENNDAEFLKNGLLKITKRQWKALSANEKANIKKFVMTVATRNLLGAAAMMLLSGNNDDEKYYKLAFYTTRLQTELLAYSDLAELNRIMQSPAVTLTMIQRIYKLTSQLSTDMRAGEYEIYQSGSKKGRTKSGKLVRDILPWGDLFEQHKYIEDILNYHYKESATLSK
jgi:hypothetical protein